MPTEPPISYPGRQRALPPIVVPDRQSGQLPAIQTIGRRCAPTVISPDIGVLLKILSLEYQLHACGKIFRMP
jgi:hypothetical protein